MNLNVSFEEKNASFDATSTNTPKTFGASINELNIVHDGQNGATFTPSVSEEGIISWTNDRDLPNPAPINIRGKDGKDGKDGYTPVKGVDYFDGKDGTNGKDGQNGRDGYTPIKGKDYFDGKDGTNGRDGYTPVKGVDYFDGKDGVNGKDGADGKTPVKGTDYFTPADKSEMVSDVIAALPVYNGEVVSV